MLLVLPPHPRAKSETRRSKPSALIRITLLRVSGFRLQVAKNVPNSPKPGNKTNRPAWYPPGGGTAAAETVKVDDDALPPGEIMEGLKAHVRPETPEQESKI